MCESLLLMESFVPRLLDNNRSAQLYKGLLIRPYNIKLLGNSAAKEGKFVAEALCYWRDEHV